MAAIAEEACDIGQGIGRDSYDMREDGEGKVEACRAHSAQVVRLEKVWQEVPGTEQTDVDSWLEGGRACLWRQRSFP